MIYKIIGAALILFCGYLTAATLNRAEHRKVEQLTAFTALLRFFKNQIDCYCVPVGEIFRRCDASLLLRCGCDGVPPDFERFILMLGTPPSPETMALLCSFESELGSSLRAEQVKSCEYHINQLAALAGAAEVEYVKRRKLTVTLCMAAAGATVILLL